MSIEAKHIIVDLYFVENKEALTDSIYLQNTIETLIGKPEGSSEVWSPAPGVTQTSGLTGQNRNSFLIFSKGGGFNLIGHNSEGHCAIKTSPEANYCSVDSYNLMSLKQIVSYLSEQFKPKKIRAVELQRGHENLLP